MSVVYFVGTDEAGYGPNLGPLVVSGTLWKWEVDSIPVSTASVLEQFNSVLEPVCCRAGAFPVFDSKKLYRSGHLAPLERSFLLAMGLLGIEAASFHDLLAVLAPSSDPLPPWEEGQEGEVSLPEPVDSHAAAQKLSQRGVSLLAAQSRRIHPERFNLLLKSGYLKSDILGEATLGLASLLARRAQEENHRAPVFVLCDKLGGRNRYLTLLQRFFMDEWFTAIEEGSSLSRYQTGQLQIQFQVKGESNRPTALASIISKYLRERSMELFNRYWIKRYPNLAPTAGYPEDAKRFAAEIDPNHFGVAMDQLWRDK